jgi:hypothetical protein
MVIWQFSFPQLKVMAADNPVTKLTDFAHIAIKNDGHAVGKDTFIRVKLIPIQNKPVTKSPYPVELQWAAVAPGERLNIHVGCTEYAYLLLKGPDETIYLASPAIFKARSEVDEAIDTKELEEAKANLCKVEIDYLLTCEEYEMEIEVSTENSEPSIMKLQCTGANFWNSLQVVVKDPEPKRKAKDVSITPTITWDTVNWATEYRLSVYDTEGTAIVKRDISLDQTVDLGKGKVGYFLDRRMNLKYGDVYLWNIYANKAGQLIGPVAKGEYQMTKIPAPPPQFQLPLPPCPIQ